MPSMKERAGLFELLHRNAQRTSSSNSGKRKSLPAGADALLSPDLTECYKIVDAACKALHPEAYATPVIIEKFFRSVFDGWSISDTVKEPEFLFRIPILESIYITKRFMFPEDLSCSISIESDPPRLLIIVEDPFRMPAGLADIMGKEGSPQSSGCQDGIMAAVGASFVERIQSHNARRAVQYARSFLSENGRLVGERFVFTDLEDFVRLLPGLSVPKLSVVESALLEWGA